MGARGWKVPSGNWPLSWRSRRRPISRLLSAAESALLLRTQALVLAPVNDLLVGGVGVDAAEPQIGHDLLELDLMVLHQVRRLLQHRAQDVAVIRACGGRCAHPGEHIR